MKAEGFRPLVTRLGFRDIDLLRMCRLGQRLQLRLGLEAQAEMAVCVQGAQQRRQTHSLQEQQRTVPSDFLQRGDGGKKAVGSLENIQFRREEKQSGKQQESDIGRLAVLPPVQESAHCAATAETLNEKNDLRR